MTEYDRNTEEIERQQLIAERDRHRERDKKREKETDRQSASELYILTPVGTGLALAPPEPGIIPPFLSGRR